MENYLHCKDLFIYVKLGKKKQIENLMIIEKITHTRSIRQWFE